jgi:hypothetical protein
VTLRLRDEGLHWRAIEGEVVAVDMRTSSYLGANPSGALLWRALAEGASRDDLVELLVGRFGINRARAGKDTDAFLGRLRAEGLLAE